MAKRKGTAGDDMLKGHGGDDRLLGLAGNDVLTGRAGDDRLGAGSGSDHLYGGSGDDVAIFTDLSYAEPDTFDGGTGKDKLDLSGVAKDPVFGQNYWEYDSQTGVYTVSQFNDPADAPAGLTFTRVETLIATNDYDLMVFVSSTDNMTIDAGGGDDWVRAGGGTVTVHGGVGNDKIDFGSDRIAFYGDAGDDDIDVGSALRGMADGGTGVDTIGSSNSVDLKAGYAMSGGGARIAISHFENISMVGAQDGAIARGDDRDNVIDSFYWPADYIYHGEGGSDRITGGDGADQVFGDDGGDVLDGAFGSDTLTGGAGADVFRFARDFFSRGDETDTVTDFKSVQGDKIDVSGLQAETLRFLGTAAFDGQAGELRYEIRANETFVQVDLDGNAAADTEIRLLGAFDLRAGDFIFVASSPAAVDFAVAPYHPVVASPDLVIA